MIDITDIRVGNFLQLEFGRIIIVDEILNNGVTYDSWGGSVVADFVEYEHLFPILLTQELLFKFGFDVRINDEDGIVYGLLNTTIIYALNDEGSRSFFLNKYCNDVEIKYVHQLQNLYYELKKDELKINIKL